MRKPLTLAAAGAAAFALLAVYPLARSLARDSDQQDFAQIERGRYLATLSDCVACHTRAPDGKPFAGGRPIETPFGTIVSPNITPDRDTGIGNWSDAEFDNAVRHGIRRDARYVVFTCADLFGGNPYYESIDLIDAFHPQTILAWAMNGAALTVPHGAPVRLRVERQLGYKHAKYVMRIDAVSSLAGIGLGKGGYWEDRVNYDWYAGI